MNRQLKLSTLLIFLFGMIVGCTDESPETNQPVITDMVSPAGGNHLASSEPNLFVSDDNRLLLSWIEVDTNKTASLRYAELINEKWNQAKTIAEGDNWFINWADFPAMATFGNGSMGAHYLMKSADAKYAYNINVVVSNDDGSTWSEPIEPHTDGTPTEHGFVSLQPYQDKMLAVWLDGRHYAEDPETGAPATNKMVVRSVFVDQNGELSEELLVDGNTCSCCQTDMAITKSGPIVVYRDRTDDEIRDIYISRLIDGRWTTPIPVASDNWHISGCPVNGPAIDSKDDLVAVAWFTAANDTSKVKVTFSDDSGERFDDPILISEGTPTGRVDLIVLDDGSALVSWIDSDSAGETVVLAQKVNRDGLVGDAFTVTEMSKSRASGFPKMAKVGDAVYFAWTAVSVDGGLSVKTSFLVVNDEL